MTNTAPQALPEPFQQRTFITQALDPIHIGTGEFRLGRVDNTIVREPGTNLPKIPGSSIAGVTRAYSAMKLDKYLRPVDGKSCAGRGGKGGDDHCGACDVCIAFGFSRANGGSFQGLAQFSDARLLFFPVYSLLGPLWITCPSALRALQNGRSTPLGNLTWDQWNKALDKTVFTDNADTIDQINLGWLYLPVLRSPKPPLLQLWAADQRLPQGLSPIFPFIALVSDALFSTIVDDQLEVRTSVSISPETGAAEPGALFTAEALPRASVFLFQVTVLNPKYFRLPNGNGGAPIAQDMNAIHSTVWKGLELVEYLGVGGVNTRGMGRLKVFPRREEEN